jgi:hypothetical protein
MEQSLLSGVLARIYPIIFFTVVARTKNELNIEKV